MASPELHGMPYTPGWARGRLTSRLSEFGQGAIVVAHQARLGALQARPAGLIVVDGAPFSHPMIRLLAWGIPVILVDSMPALSEGAEVVLDGVQGAVFFAPEAGLMPPPAPPVPRAGMAVRTANGEAVHLRASVADASGAARALARGAAAIGLVRSECLLPPADAVPDVAFYEQTLATLCEAAAPLAVTVRLLDIAADKRPRWLTRTLPGMAGPLGLQGARLYAMEPVRSVFRAEVAALGRLAQDHDLSVLVPYVAGVEEFQRWRGEIEDMLPAPMAIGSMVETPAAALAVADLLTAADFVALGCNDLMQCLFAVDRDIPALARLLDAYAPVLYRFLRDVARAAEGEMRRVQVCGLLAQLPGLMPVMLGLGYRAFSVEPVMLPYLAEAVSRTDTQAAAALGAAVCAASDSASVRALLTMSAPPTPVGGAPQVQGVRVWR